uniref:Uncharacterized protein n=1 Tax=Onchocerca volvulus TaxID=6282 RepID=A0A8R1TXK5_ONCVO
MSRHVSIVRAGVKGHLIDKRRLLVLRCKSCSTLTSGMDRVRIQFDDNTRNFIGNQRFTDLRASPISIDSGISTERNISLNNSAYTDLSIISNSANPRNIRENIEDENKENIRPILQERHTDAAFLFMDGLDSSPERRNNVNVGNLLRLFSRPFLDNEHENHYEHEREASTSPLSVEHRSPRSSPVTSPLRWPNFWPQFGTHPINGTPRHSPEWRRARTLMEEAEFVSLEDLPEVNPFGPNSIPPRTPSRESFVGICNDSENQNPNEVLVNEQREKEFAIVEVANVAMSTIFVTPPFKPLVPPMAPRKKKINRKSLKTANSPSYFPQTIDSPSFFPKKSHTVRHMLPKEHRLFHPPTVSMLSMVLRSAAKPRRSTRIKKMPNRYKCNFHLCVDSRKKRKRRILLEKRFTKKIYKE